MNTFPPTIIIRHKKENLNKCSLRGLEERSDMRFYLYPLQVALPPLTNYVVLSFDGPVLSEADRESGLLLIDGTWRYAAKMFKTLPEPFETRSLPAHFRTAYPRRQQDCAEPERGLASIEALFVAYALMGRKDESLLSNYYWRDPFIKLNF